MDKLFVCLNIILNKGYFNPCMTFKDMYNRHYQVL